MCNIQHPICSLAGYLLLHNPVAAALSLRPVRQIPPAAPHPAAAAAAAPRLAGRPIFVALLPVSMPGLATDAAAAVAWAVAAAVDLVIAAVSELRVTSKAPHKPTKQQNTGWLAPFRPVKSWGSQQSTLDHRQPPITPDD